MTAGARSPLAPQNVPELPGIGGVLLAVAETNTKYKNRADVMLAVLEPGTVIAGVLTQSKTASAPVDWCREHLKTGTVRGLVVNAGNANAFTGERGINGVVATAQKAAGVIGCTPEEVFVASTGVIGEMLDADAITRHFDAMYEGASAAIWPQAAAAIMTTDTYPKLATATADIDGHQVTINGFAKGSGMIAPDMATMLGFLFTDANLPAGVLQELLRKSTDQSFNSITVDGDTSTSDTVLLCATGVAHTALDGLTDAHDPRLSGFSAALNDVTRNLAHQIVRDGEGAEKFVTINVKGAESNAAARRIGLSIGNSPLVKTAIAGADANWGRIVMAVGKSGEKADRDRLMIHIGGVLVAEKGLMAAGYNEAMLVPHMHSRHVEIDVDVGIAAGSATIWTCDLTHRYIDINADYRS